MKVKIENNRRGEGGYFEITISPETKEDKEFIQYFEEEDDYIEKYVDKEGNIKLLI